MVQLEATNSSPNNKKFAKFITHPTHISKRLLPMELDTAISPKPFRATITLQTIQFTRILYMSLNSTVNLSRNSLFNIKTLILLHLFINLEFKDFICNFFLFYQKILDFVFLKIVLPGDEIRYTCSSCEYR